LSRLVKLVLMMLQAKTALITGASSGIGAAVAEKLAAGGVKVVLVARRIDRLEALAKKLQTQYQASVFIAEADVRQAEAMPGVLHSLPKLFRDIDILVNSAGLAAGLDLVQDADLTDWDQMIDTNFKGLVYATRAVLPFMQARGVGHIVNVSSLAAHRTYPGGSVYCATKAAVQSFTRALKLECQGQNIRVTDIAPGMVETEFSEVRFKGDAERAKQVYADLVPLSAEEVADAVYYAVSRPAHVNISEIVIVANQQAIQLV
jgi:3-hydroxy acid dehydrogenase/malonic semialdehyde reductase